MACKHINRENKKEIGTKNTKVEVQKNNQEIIEQNENKQSQLEEHQQKTYHICSFPEDNEILEKKAEMERYNEEEKELLMRVVKEIRYDPEKVPPYLRYIDRKKVRTATMKINKIASLIMIDLITEKNSVLRAAGNIVIELQKQGDDRKRTTKLVKQNFREAEGIMERVRRIKWNETKGIEK